MHPEDDFRIAGYRLEGEWHDVEKGARLPEGSEWHAVDLITLNLDPTGEEGFYRRARLPFGLDEPGGDYDVYDLAGEMKSSYGFASE